MEGQKAEVPHVLIFPMAAQGHVNSMLKLAELLCLSDLHVTFLNTEHYHHRLLRYTDAQTRFSSFPKFLFDTITDGLPDDHPRTIDRVADIFKAIDSTVKPAFRELMTSGRFESANRPPVTCIIVDGLIASTADVAKELGIPWIAFRTASAAQLWCCYCYRNSVEAGEVPFGDDDMDKPVASVPGMESFLRLRDLPSFYRAKVGKWWQHVAFTETINSTGASATILNTFDDLEGPILSKMAPHFPRIYTIGPLHALLNSRLPKSLLPSVSSNSLWEVDRSCMSWLDSQPLKSVVYVSFGSIVLMTRQEMLEFWHGLVNSGKRFLWVLRQDAVVDKDEPFEIPRELTEATKERGYIVGWSPQEEVLVHPAVGGFVTHSGWNSTLESVVAGLPMVCWPRIGDQQINSRFVSEVWKIGLDMKDTCDRSTMEKMVNDLMDQRSDELRESMDKMSSMAKKSVSQGGSSCSNLEKLVEDIKSMNLKV